MCDTSRACRFESVTVISNRCSELVAALKGTEIADMILMLKLTQKFDSFSHNPVISEIFIRNIYKNLMCF